MNSSFSLVYFCEKCEHGYRVPKGDPNRRLLSIVMPCPTKGCDGSIEYGDPYRAVKHGETMSAQILFEACMGHGFPHERVCSPEHLHRLMDGAEIIDVELDSAGPNRSFINTMLVSKDDVRHRLFFAMSTKGATIFKVQEETDG